MPRAHRKLLAWRESVDLVREVYSLTQSFPAEERFGLSSQMRRAAVSIPSNIAEGAARTSRKEFLQFLSIATGSLSELDTHLEVARTLGFIDDIKSFQDRLDRLQALLHGLRRSVSAQS